MSQMSRRRSSAAWCLQCVLLAACLPTSACLFPVIDFEDHATASTRGLAFRGGHAPLQNRWASAASAAGPRAFDAGRAERASATAGTGHIGNAYRAPGSTRLGDRSVKPSVMSPSIPESEPQNPAGERACHAALSHKGVQFSAVADDVAPGVHWPIRLNGPVRGVVFEARERSPTYEILDCRLALALYDWASELRRNGVRRVEYYSMYRPFARIAGSGRTSGHARGMAIDAASFALQSGTIVNVLEDWEGRKRGQSPCPSRSYEARAGRLLRSVTCSAADLKLFQVILTPHYNHAHDNHVHLEVKPEVDWTYVR